MKLSPLKITTICATRATATGNTNPSARLSRNRKSEVGVFTPLLSNLPLESVLKRLAGLKIHTVELGTANYPGDPHCKLSVLDNPATLEVLKKSWMIIAF